MRAQAIGRVFQFMGRGVGQVSQCVLQRLACQDNRRMEYIINDALSNCSLAGLRSKKCWMLWNSC